MRPQVRLLGRFEIGDGTSWHEPPSHKTVALLAYLAFQGEWVERETLAALFWPETDGPAARSNLRSLWARSRSLPWAEDLESRDARVRWRVTCDVHAFRNAIDANRWDDAIAAYRGDLLDNTSFGGSGPFASWLQIERESLRDAYRTAAVQRVHEAVRDGRRDDAIAHLASMLEVDPLDEEAVQLGMRLHAESGRPAHALRLFRSFRQRLVDELELEPTTATAALARSIQEDPGRPSAASDVSATRGRSRKVRAPPTSFIGRDVEIQDISARLARPDSRLVTVVGTGGVGKTRLALRAADLMARRYAKGTFIASLEGVTSGHDVPAAIANALGVTLRSRNDPMPQLMDAIGDADALLVLDNFEHVLDAASVVAGILSECPRVDVLATSRERLGIDGEWLLPLRGLAYPGRDIATGDALGYEAVRCFVERVRQVRPDFRLDDASLRPVVEVCRTVEGLPLGLELAAVWARVMPVEDIAAEIARNLDFLRRERGAGAERHQSIRATFEHSWGLLAEAERDALRRLAVFRGGFRRSAAAFVADASIAVLAALVDKSLLRASLDGRYDRHPLVHALTLQKLGERPDDARDARERHARYFAWILQEAEPHRGTERQVEWRERLEPDAENLAAALAYAVDRRDGDLALRLLPALRWRWWPDGHVDERSKIVADVLALDASQRHPMRVHALHIAGVLAVNLRRHDEARAFGEEALALVPDEEPLGIWLRANLATLALTSGDRRSARALLRECLERKSAVGFHTGVASALNHLGGMERADGNVAAAREMHEEALSIGYATRDTLTICRALNGLGYVAQARGHLERARACLEDGVRLADMHRHHASQIAALHALGDIAHRSGDARRARELHARALVLSRSTATYRLLHRSLEAAGDLLAADGQPLEAARAWGAAGALRAAAGVHVSAADADRRSLRREEVRTACGPEAFDAALETGGALDAAGAVAAAVAALGT